MHHADQRLASTALVVQTPSHRARQTASRPSPQSASRLLSTPAARSGTHSPRFLPAAPLRCPCRKRQSPSGSVPYPACLHRLQPASCHCAPARQSSTMHPRSRTPEESPAPSPCACPAPARPPANPTHTSPPQTTPAPDSASSNKLLFSHDTPHRMRKTHAERITASVHPPRIQ